MDIILYYNGQSPHIKWCVESIRQNSPRSPLHVLGSPGLDVPHIDHALYYERAAEFWKIYKHDSGNSVGLELNALARWIVMLEYCQKNGIQQFAHFDCDELILCDLEEEAKRFADVDFTYPICSGMFFNPEVLRFLVKLIFDYYEGKENECSGLIRELRATHGHMSDMVFRDVLCNRFRWKSTVEGDRQFEGCFHYPEGFVLDEHGYRKLEFDNGKPYITRTDGRRVELLSIHCWGLLKTRMKEIWDQCKH